MNIDLSEIKEWIINAVKRSLAGEVYMPCDEADKAFNLLAALDTEIVLERYIDKEINVPEGENVIISKEKFNQIQKLLNEGQKIQAIKMLRTETRIDLKDAKYAVEDPTNWDLTEWNRRRKKMSRL